MCAGTGIIITGAITITGVAGTTAAIGGGTITTIITAIGEGASAVILFAD
jgi:hypothetical protein